jgi:hypothetical protein
MAMTGRSSGSARLVREPLSAHRHLLALWMLLTQQDDQARFLVLVADAVESLGPCGAEGVFVDGEWQVACFRGQAPDCAAAAATPSSAVRSAVRLAEPTRIEPPGPATRTEPGMFTSRCRWS